MRKRYGDLKKRIVRTQGVELNNPNVLYIFTLRSDCTPERAAEFGKLLSSLGVARYALQIADAAGEGCVEVLGVTGVKNEETIGGYQPREGNIGTPPNCGSSVMKQKED